METEFLHSSQERTDVHSAALVKGVGWGLMGGLVGTLVMDLILMGALSIVGMSAFTCFSIVGDTVASFLSMLGVERAGGVPLGIATHYVIGPLIGVIFGAAITRRAELQVGIVKRSVVLAVVYVEILSQPILAMTPLLLKMTVKETLQWFAGSFIMHLIWGLFLGGVVRYGLRLAVVPNDGQEA